MYREDQARLTQVQQELRDHQESYRQRLSEVNACKRREADHQSRKKTLQLEHQRAQTKVDTLQSELDEATPDAAAIEVLVEQLDNLKEEAKHIEDQLEDMLATKFELDNESRAKKQELESAQKVNKDIEFKLTKAHATVRRLQNTREEQLKAKNDAIERVNKGREVKAEWEAHRAGNQRDIETAIASASTFCAREDVIIPEGKTSEALWATKEKLEKTRKETEKDLGGSQEQLLREANEAKKMHKDAAEEFKDIINLRNVS